VAGGFRFIGIKMKQQLVPKYAHLEYQVLHELDISVNEYFLLDMIYRLSRIGWCNKKLDNIAFDMNLSQRGIIKLRNRLIERKLLIKGIGNRLKTSEKLNKVYFIDESSLRKTALSSQKLNKVHSKTEQSVSKTSVENNTEINKDNKGVEKRGSGYKAALQARNSLVRGLTLH
jgi:hypothetical protein